jgi:transcriptional antiterminator RfaH
MTSGAGAARQHELAAIEEAVSCGKIQRAAPVVEGVATPMAPPVPPAIETVVEAAEGERWYVICAQPNHDYFVRRQLMVNRWFCFLPECLERQRRGRTVQDRKLPLFPGYLFVRFNLDRVECNRSPFLCYGDRPEPVPVGVIEKIARDMKGAGGAIPVGAALRDRLKPGVQLRILGGVFEGLTGLYEGSASERIILLVDILGGNVRVVLDDDLVALCDETAQSLP